jgi:hypothetical protein
MSDETTTLIEFRVVVEVTHNGSTPAQLSLVASECVGRNKYMCGDGSGKVLAVEELAKEQG